MKRSARPIKWRVDCYLWSGLSRRQRIVLFPVYLLAFVYLYIKHSNIRMSVEDKDE